MGAFFLSRGGESESARALFRAKGLGHEARASLSGYTLQVFGRNEEKVPPIVRGQRGNIVVAVGPVFYRGRGGIEALRGFADDFSADASVVRDLTGQFALVHSDGREVSLLTDRTGYVWIYRDPTGDTFSTSMRAVLDHVPRRTFRRQEILEYLVYQAPFGGRTVVEEVSILDSGPIHDLRSDGPPVARDRAAPESPEPSAPDRWLDDVSRNLLEYFGDLQATYGDRFSVGLSGGFDSRLMLALLRAVGAKPYLYTYGRPESADVVLTGKIAEGEGIEIEAIDRSLWPRLDPDEFATQVERNFAFFEVQTIDGVFKNASDLDTRIDRANKGDLLLHGGGAEMYRNRWALPDGRYSVEQIIAAHFDSFDSAPLRGFDRGSFFGAIQAKIRRALGADVDRLDHHGLTMTYGLLTEKYGVGHNNCINNQLGHSLMPFMEHHLLAQAAQLPHRLKFAAGFNRELICRLDPKLASYPTQYGFDFAHRVPAKNRLKYWLIDHTPIAIRGPIRRRNLQRNILYRRGAAELSMPYFLGAEYLDRVIEPGPRAMDEYVDFDRITNPSMLSRAYTLELLMRRYG